MEAQHAAAQQWLLACGSLRSDGGAHSGRHRCGGWLRLTRRRRQHCAAACSVRWLCGGSGGAVASAGGAGGGGSGSGVVVRLGAGNVGVPSAGAPPAPAVVLLRGRDGRGRAGGRRHRCRYGTFRDLTALLSHALHARQLDGSSLSAQLRPLVQQLHIVGAAVAGQVGG